MSHTHTHTHAPAQHTHILLKWTFTATDPKWLLGATKSSWNWQKISSEQRTSSFIRTRALTHQLSGVPRRAVLWRVCECVEHGACKTDNKCVSGDQKCDSQQSGKVHRRVTKSADRNSQREWTSLTHFSLFFPHSIVSVSLTALCPQAASHPPSLPPSGLLPLSLSLSLSRSLSLPLADIRGQSQACWALYRKLCTPRKHNRHKKVAASVTLRPRSCLSPPLLRLNGPPQTLSSMLLLLTFLISRYRMYVKTNRSTHTHAKKVLRNSDPKKKYIDSYLVTHNQVLYLGSQESFRNKFYYFFVESFSVGPVSCSQGVFHWRRVADDFFLGDSIKMFYPKLQIGHRKTASGEQI